MAFVIILLVLAYKLGYRAPDGGACCDDSMAQGNAAAQHPAGAVTKETPCSDRC